MFCEYISCPWWYSSGILWFRFVFCCFAPTANRWAASSVRWLLGSHFTRGKDLSGFYSHHEVVWGFILKIRSCPFKSQFTMNCWIKTLETVNSHSTSLFRLSEWDELMIASDCWHQKLQLFFFFFWKTTPQKRFTLQVSLMTLQKYFKFCHIWEWLIHSNGIDFIWKVQKNIKCHFFY